MRRVVELDAIRGVAAVVIMMTHLWWRERLYLPNTAVDCFFVLSGFLITGIILKHGGSKGFMPVFYARRGLRIWPIYYLVVVGVAVVNAFLPSPSPMNGLVYYLTYTQNIQYYWSATVPPITPLLDHTWTLALEEQFYLIWPPLVCLAGRRRVVPLALGVVALSVWARGPGGFTGRTLLARCDGFAMGGLLAALMEGREWNARDARRFALTLGGLAAVSLTYPVWGRLLLRGLVHAPDATVATLNLFFVTLLYFCLVGTASCFAGRPWLAPLRDRRLAYLGLISYGLYLYHPLVYAAGDAAAARLGFGRSLGLDLVKLAATVGVAALSWRFIEQPILTLKDRFDYRERPLPAEDSGPSPLQGAVETVPVPSAQSD